MSEITRIGDRITVLRDGRKVATLDAAEASEMRLVELMTGRVISQIFPKVDYRPARRCWRSKGLDDGDRQRVERVDPRAERRDRRAWRAWSARAKSEVARACFGVEPIAAGADPLRRRRDVSG